jgi:hypothetical protein
MKKYIVLLFVMNFVALQARDMFLVEVENQTKDGYFKISDPLDLIKGVRNIIICPQSKLVLKNQDTKIPISSSVMIFAVKGFYEPIFLQRGESASGTCLSSNGPETIVHWYGYPTISSQLKEYTPFCLNDDANVCLRILENGAVEFSAIGGAEMVNKDSEKINENAVNENDVNVTALQVQ